MNTPGFNSLAEWRAHRRGVVGGWFLGHVADLTGDHIGGVAFQRLVWKKPGTGINRIDFVCDGPHLFVTGDLGDAIYEAGGSGLQWWSGCDLEYFAGKCVASETGRGYREWDRDAAWIRLRQMFDQADEQEAEAWERCVEGGAEHELSSESEWTLWLHNAAEEVWGANWTDREPWGIGSVVSLRCEGHLLGLQLAMRQLSATERAP